MFFEIFEFSNSLCEQTNIFEIPLANNFYTDNTYNGILLSLFTHKLQRVCFIVFQP